MIIVVSLQLNQIHLNESAESELNSILNTENFSKISSNALGRKRKDPEFIRIEKLLALKSQIRLIII